MAHSSFSLFRSRDGRSLARALACLLLVNLISGGFHAGMATGGDGIAICSVASDLTADPSNGPASPTDRDHACCLLGCVTAPVLLTSSVADILRRDLATKADETGLTPTAPSPQQRSAANRPRGPPILA